MPYFQHTKGLVWKSRESTLAMGDVEVIEYFFKRTAGPQTGEQTRASIRCELTNDLTFSDDTDYKKLRSVSK